MPSPCRTRRRFMAARIASLPPAARRMLRPGALGIYLSLAVICLICLVPVIWTLSSSLKTREELYAIPPTLLPQNPTLLNYTWMLTREDMSRLPLNLWNSLKVTMGAVTVVAIVVTEPGHAVQGAVVLSVMVVTGTVGAGVTGGAAVEATPAADEDGASEVGAATG